MFLAPLFDRNQFRILPGVAHVCAGGETPFLYRHQQAFEAYARDKSSGSAGRLLLEAKSEQARDLVAALWQVESRQIGFVSSVAEGVSILVESLDWQEGDHICVMNNEYPSVVAPFLKQGRVRFASDATLNGLKAIVNSKTRVIACSQVSYLNGERYSLPALRRLADSVGAMLIVDFTQASGYMPIDASLADFAFSACYKWMLGMTGIAVAFWNTGLQPKWEPRTAGWYSITDGTRYDAGIFLREGATRFTRGNPCHSGLYVLCEALDFLSQFKPEEIQGHVQSLTFQLLRELDELGIASTTPVSNDRHGASICVTGPGARDVVKLLEDQKVYAWNGRGRIRFSFHGYNGSDDVASIAAALRTFPEGLLATLLASNSGASGHAAGQFAQGR